MLWRGTSFKFLAVTAKSFHKISVIFVEAESMPKGFIFIWETQILVEFRFSNITGRNRSISIPSMTAERMNRRRRAANV